MTSRYKELQLEKTDILELQRSYTALQPAQANSTVQILRSILPAMSRKMQEGNTCHPFPHGRRLRDQWTSFQQIWNTHRQLHSPNVNSYQGNILADIHHQQPATASDLQRASFRSHIFFSGDMLLQIVCHKRQHKHLTVCFLEKYEDTLSYHGARVSNRDFLISFQTQG